MSLDLNDTICLNHNMVIFYLISSSIIDTDIYPTYYNGNESKYMLTIEYKIYLYEVQFAYGMFRRSKTSA